MKFVNTGLLLASVSAYVTIPQPKFHASVWLMSLPCFPNTRRFVDHNEVVQHFGKLSVNYHNLHVPILRSCHFSILPGCLHAFCESEDTLDISQAPLPSFFAMHLFTRWKQKPRSQALLSSFFFFARWSLGARLITRHLFMEGNCPVD